MKRFLGLAIGLFSVIGFTSSAEAITITLAEVQNGVAVVQGNKAAKSAIITWDGLSVTQTSKGGSFSFSGTVPADCVGTLSDGTSTIDVVVLDCTPVSTGVGVLATGQTTCYDSVGTVINCAGTGQDGELQKGTARSYTNNADGTITDNGTGLVWEKLTNDGTIHDWDNVYTWPDAVLVKIAALNMVPCFANHCDWRLPNINELLTLLDYGQNSPAIDPIFNSAGSFTKSEGYWSSTTYQRPTSYALFVDFNDGGLVHGLNKEPFALYVRAVRGGS
jgi:Protein of unknown function (DUF1566)